jgi:hypothetical protein
LFDKSAVVSHSLESTSRHYKIFRQCREMARDCGEKFRRPPVIGIEKGNQVVARFPDSRISRRG